MWVTRGTSADTAGRSFLQESLLDFGSAGLLLAVLRMHTDPKSGRLAEPSFVGEAIQLAGRDTEAAMQGWLDQLFRQL